MLTGKITSLKQYCIWDVIFNFECVIALDLIIIITLS